MASAQPPPSVQPPAAKELIDQKGYTLLDVRTPEERAQGSVPGSINIPIKLDDGKGGMVPNPDFEEQVKAQLSKDTSLVCTCAHGRRGGDATARLAAQGFTTINLEGGLANWADQKQPVDGTIQRHH
ncbi:hypothetical protein CHLNCDRAFT_136471 [Chlorella variabilis]|uniref:Rhodanese domain-containing protein n=1 Tax=Chlorella variabilis TaxID=554065 RepID=E1ZKF0_CHLVA|nr:hypothetical protein CHLNCDRAFT_136471 [Chlorella variabilis]EFN53680.1 hypothetical protein CHLNCDRAFT_136471 [Chlorella variabilis]|eukprot:XP_005845782.1 hypothetical protein CHLNCDRAFT_136471 [Chlorella variabilis]